jgi:lysyl-tRNA synthetase class 2
VEETRCCHYPACCRTSPHRCHRCAASTSPLTAEAAAAAQPKPGGAAARPFATHHNALNMQLFMRIAPELYLKRLLVGGMERVYEINRNFRNEGLSRKHNPEFTMLEFYQAYATWEDMMELTEEMLCEVAATIHTPNESGEIRFIAEEQEVSFARPWRRLRMSEGVAAALGVDEAQLDDIDFLREAARKAGADVTVDYDFHSSRAQKMWERFMIGYDEPAPGQSSGDCVLS